MVMNITRIIGLLLITHLSIGLYAMESSFAKEQQLILNNISAQAYLSDIEKSGTKYGHKIGQLRTADYSRSPDGNYYEQLINKIDAAARLSRLNRKEEKTFRNLHFKIMLGIEDLYHRLQQEKKLGAIQ